MFFIITNSEAVEKAVIKEKAKPALLKEGMSCFYFSCILWLF